MARKVKKKASKGPSQSGLLLNCKCCGKKIRKYKNNRARYFCSRKCEDRYSSKLAMQQLMSDVDAKCRMEAARLAEGKGK